MNNVKQGVLVAVGGVLVLYGLARRSWVGIVLILVGGYAIYRGLAGYFLSDKNPQDQFESEASDSSENDGASNPAELALPAQIFHPSANIIARATVFGTVFILAGLGLLGYFYVRSAYASGVDVAVEQPVLFSHQHHVGELGLDCRYCHTSVSTSSFAGMPSTKTCMTCHSQIWTGSPLLVPVQVSWHLDTPIAWARVYDLPDFVYFDHSIHVSKGVGCETCHGRVDQMPVIWKTESLQMSWCLECHRAPQRFLRPQGDVTKMGYEPPEDQLGLGEKLVRDYHIPVQLLTDCYACHR